MIPEPDQLETGAERQMLEAVLASGVPIAPGRRYSLDEVARIVQSSPAHKAPHGRKLSMQSVAALMRDEGESEARGEIPTPGWVAYWYLIARRKFAEAWLEMFGEAWEPGR
jgi:hypothetical protein